MNIIIPLGGKGERFQKEGYLEPKPLIKVLNKEILFYTIDNLSITDEDKVFIVYNKDLESYNFESIISNKYPNINLIKLDYQTKGASETVFIGVKNIMDNHQYNKKTILIDGDAFYTEDILDKFRKVDTENAVFYTKNYDKNPIFSYIKMDNMNNIIDIKEKDKISDNANTGGYALNDINKLYEYAKFVVENNIVFKNECYTSCIINEMIKKNEPFIGIELKDEFVFVLGTPLQVTEYINKTHAFLFDLDGTLVITDEIYYNIWEIILKKYNIYLTNEIFKNNIQGNNDYNVFQKLLPNKKIDISEISITKDKLFNENINKIKIIDGALDFIKLVKQHGHKINIVTNCNYLTAKNILENCDLTKYIDHIIIGNECSRPKPYSDPYQKACNLVTINPNKSFVFEDSKTGILSGRSLNPKCLIGIKTIYDNETLKNLGVNICIDNYKNLFIEDLINYKIDFNKNIEQFIKNSIKENITNIEIFNEKIKGGYISDVIKVIIEIDNSKKLDCILKLENPNETKLSKMATKLGLYEREYYFYENISKYVNIEIPKFYGLIKDNNLNNVGILLENLNTENTYLNLNLNEVDINVSMKIIESAAKLHSKFWNENLINIFPNLLKNDDPRFNPVWTNYINENWDLFKLRWQYLLNEKQVNIAEKIVKNFSKIQKDLSNRNLTLCHGDIKSPNIFYRKLNDEYIPYFIDWQYISYGKGVQDIIFLMIESFDIKNSLLYVPLLKNYYYIKLMENKIENYSYDDYEKDFINSICYYPFFVAIWFGITPEEDLIDKNFPFFFIQKLFNFILNYVPEDFYE